MSADEKKGGQPPRRVVELEVACAFLRGEVARLRAALNRAHMGITLALQVREDIELRGALDEIEKALTVKR